MRGHIGVAFALSAVAYACGGGDGNTGPLTEADATALCERGCTYDIMCGSEQTQADCVSDCVMELSGWVRADAYESLIECQEGVACDDNDGEDACFLMVEALPIHHEWEEGCKTQLAGCSDIDVTTDCDVDSERDSGLFRFIAPAIMEEFIDCLDAADCEARLTCIQTVAAKYNIDF